MVKKVSTEGKIRNIPWSKEFLEAGKQRLTGNTQRQADSNEVKTRLDLSQSDHVNCYPVKFR